MCADDVAICGAVELASHLNEIPSAVQSSYRRPESERETERSKHEQMKKQNTSSGHCMFTAPIAILSHACQQLTL